MEYQIIVSFLAQSSTKLSFVPGLVVPVAEDVGHSDEDVGEAPEPVGHELAQALPALDVRAPGAHRLPRLDEVSVDGPLPIRSNSALTCSNHVIPHALQDLNPFAPL